jgi:hypothetical protein
MGIEGERYLLPAGMSGQEAINAAVNEVALRRARETEAVIREHLESHDVLDWVRTVQRLQMELAQIDGGIRPHVYRDEWRIDEQR